ncbi:hypothetical protein B0T11DRAFT_286109 [Plectosphaerella cucumerina]|uniref:Iron-dependent peroxidase n=1 Tax=Plectosphaerella cucumerina TaxID=40658 RepID=A0A8K0X3Y7_9PEZI|nr:hypothetical protein B0T11DRAFT_286109 [Plectosphaerella cucumerina]
MRNLTQSISFIFLAMSQSVTWPLTRAATFLVLCARPGPQALATIRSTLAGVPGLAKNVSVRGPDARFACTVGIGSNVWDSLTGLPRPAELRPFPVFRGAVHATVSTPGDLLFHIRSDRRDLNFEFERQLLAQLGVSVEVADETSGFRYFDGRDLLGFVDGTANPDSQAEAETAAVMSDDPHAIGGSYVVVQKYLHDLKGWSSLKSEEQEAVIGRTKLDNVELDDAPEGHFAHKTLATVTDEKGQEHDILRDNMPFGAPGKEEYGTYFIGYSARLWVTEKMLERMFVGVPEGKHDRILDYSRAVTGGTFFVPSVDVLGAL